MAAIMGHNLRRHLEGRHHDPDQERLPDTIRRLIETGCDRTDERGLPWTSSHPPGRATCRRACRRSWTSTSIPAEAVYDAQVAAAANPHEQPQVMRDLQARRASSGLWNLFMTHGSWGAGLTNLEYAPLMELAGRSIIGPEALNCSAPDTGQHGDPGDVRHAGAAGAVAAPAARLPRSARPSR